MTILARVRAVLGGESVPLDEGAIKMLHIMMEGSKGCDARITAEAFTLRCADGDAHHPYLPELAPAIASWFRTMAPAGYLPAGTMPYGRRMPGRWSYGAFSVWIEDERDSATILVRAVTDRDEAGRKPLPFTPAELDRAR